MDGNLLTNGVWSFTWDAENRLVSACSNNVLRVRNTYDSRSRRIRKEVSAYNASTGNYEPVTCNAFLWDGWNVFREVRDQMSAVSTNYYTWGLDLSGSLQGAGGVGGLLAVTTVSAANPQPVIHFPLFDANGNVTEYVTTNGAVAARYAYDAFGNTVAASGPLADAFTHRFSTKPFDAETGLVMYQLRPYEPGLGRWLSKDPIEERGGLNLYGFVGNNAISLYDNFGLSFWNCCDDCCGTVLDVVDTQLWPALYDNRVSPNIFKTGFDLLSAINASGNVSDFGDIASSCTSVPGLLSSVAKVLINKGMNWDANTAVEQGINTLMDNNNKAYGETGGYVIYVRINYRMCESTRTCWKLKKYRALSKIKTFSQRYSNTDRIPGFLESDGFFLPEDRDSLRRSWKQSIKDAINAIPD